MKSIAYAILAVGGLYVSADLSGPAIQWVGFVAATCGMAAIAVRVYK
jgi:hypothetical protein